MNIKIKNARCIMISSELKILPSMWLSLESCIIVLDATIIGDMHMPNKEQAK